MAKVARTEWSPDREIRLEYLDDGGIVVFFSGGLKRRIQCACEASGKSANELLNEAVQRGLRNPLDLVMGGEP